MKVIVYITGNFKKEAKPLFKKYVSLKTDLLRLQEELLLNPTLGTSLRHNAYKIRLKIASKGKVKSGGARIISQVETEMIAQIENNTRETIVNLLSIYDKSDTENISDKELKALIANLKPQ